jgi:hypothetical protein
VQAWGQHLAPALDPTCAAVVLPSTRPSSQLSTCSPTTISHSFAYLECVHRHVHAALRECLLLYSKRTQMPRFRSIYLHLDRVVVSSQVLLIPLRSRASLSTLPLPGTMNRYNTRFLPTTRRHDDTTRRQEGALVAFSPPPPSLVSWHPSTCIQYRPGGTASRELASLFIREK